MIRRSEAKEDPHPGVTKLQKLFADGGTFETEFMKKLMEKLKLEWNIFRTAQHVKSIMDSMIEILPDDDIRKLIAKGRFILEIFPLSDEDETSLKFVIDDDEFYTDDEYCSIAEDVIYKMCIFKHVEDDYGVFRNEMEFAVTKFRWL